MQKAVTPLPMNSPGNPDFPLRVTVRGVEWAPMGFAEPNEVLVLEREKDNKADPNAIRVAVRDRPTDLSHLGYVAKEQTELLEGVNLAGVQGLVRFPLNPVEQTVDLVMQGEPSPP